MLPVRVWCLVTQSQIYHVVGPPGTGKTTHLARQASLAVEKYGPEGVTIVSLTRAAAAEIGGRDSGVAAERVGTMHSLLYRDRYKGKLILDSPKGIKAWNEWAAARNYHAWRLSGGGTDPDDPHGNGSATATAGDELLERMQLARHRLQDPTTWLPSVKAFALAWIDCCDELDATDFTQLVETGLDLDACPGQPRVLLADEVQDFSALEASVLRQWAQRTETTVMVGDGDQAIYEWRGADPRGLDVDAAHRRVLGQSYRVPKAVHEVAQRVIGRVRERIPAPYLPTPEAGEVETLDGARWGRPEGWLSAVLERLERCRKNSVTDPAQGVMVLAPCAYQVEPILALLRREGIPYGNRYRRKRGDWNPLAGSDTDRATAANQLAAYLAGGEAGWTAAQLRLWIPLLRSRVKRGDNGVLARGAKTTVERTETERLTPGAFDGLFASPFDGERAKDRRVEWLLEGAAQKDRDRLRYPVAVYRRGGLEALKSEPLLTVGTIHSAKGGEAAHVLLSTSLPPRWATLGETDELHRLMYVGITRASTSLTLLSGDVGRYRT